MVSKFSLTYPKKIGDTLTEFTNIVVPMFQRNYAWHSEDTGQVSELWNDLYEKFSDYRYIQSYPSSSATDNGEYLLGPMVFLSPTNTSSKVEIVDGQQRLATITMIFCIARDIILELNYDKIKTNPTYIPQELSGIKELIENYHEDIETGIDVHDSWKIELNSVDKDIFCNIVQEYKPGIIPNEDFRDDISEVYYKISKKISYVEGELKGDSKNNYKDSEILIFKAYISLYEKINNALIVDFNNNLDSDDEIGIINEDIKNKTIKKLKTTPAIYKLSPDFFTNNYDGYDVLTKGNWVTEDDKKIHEEHDKYNATRREQDKDEVEFEIWITNKLNRKLRKKNPIDSYNTILEREIKKSKSSKYKSRKLINMTRLSNFCKIGVAGNMSTIRVEVSNDEDAYDIFETLNAKGETLSKSNLIKNWVISQIDEDKIIDNAEKWDRIIDFINSDPDKFLRLSLLSRGYQEEFGVSKFVFGVFPIMNSQKPVKATTNNFYKIIKKRIQNSAFAIQFLKDLDADAKIFNSFNSAVKSFPDADHQKKLRRNDAKPSIIDMNYLNAEYIQISLFNAYRKWGGHTSEEFILLTKFLVPFFFRYKTVSNRAVTILEKIAFVICDTIQNGQDSERLINLKKIIKYVLQYDDENAFQNDFITRFEPPTESNSKFVLYHIETYLANDTDDKKTLDDLELEHVLPKSPKIMGDAAKKWDKTDFFKGYSYDDHKILKIFPKWIGKLGNLTLLKTPVNTDITNFNFLTKRDFQKDEKAAGYNSSELQINKQTIMKIQETSTDRLEWTAESILVRGDYLQGFAQKIWSLPGIYCTNPSCHINLHPTKVDGDIDKIDEQKCTEDLGGTICDHELIVRWQKDCGPEYKVADAYLS